MDRLHYPATINAVRVECEYFRLGHTDCWVNNLFSELVETTNGA